MAINLIVWVQRLRVSMDEEGLLPLFSARRDDQISAKGAAFSSLYFAPVPTSLLPSCVCVILRDFSIFIFYNNVILIVASFLLLLRVCCVCICVSLCLGNSDTLSFELCFLKIFYYIHDNIRARLISLPQFKGSSIFPLLLRE